MISIIGKLKSPQITVGDYKTLTPPYKIVLSSSHRANILESFVFYILIGWRKPSWQLPIIHRRWETKYCPKVTGLSQTSPRFHHQFSMNLGKYLSICIPLLSIPAHGFKTFSIRMLCGITVIVRLQISAKETVCLLHYAYTFCMPGHTVRKTPNTHAQNPLLLCTIYFPFLAKACIWNLMQPLNFSAITSFVESHRMLNSIML